jgi:xanthine dehydrogenase accessory factor
MTGWIAAIKERIGKEPLALVSILATEGSAPRGAGTRMVVDARAVAGTIGGGALEYQAIEQARAILSHPPGSWRIQDYPLGPLLGQCCGGRVRLMVEHLDPARCGWLDAAAGTTLVARLHADHVARGVDDVILPPPLSARGARPEVGDAFAERSAERRRPLYLFGAGHVGQAVARRVEGLPFTLCWFDTRPDYAAMTGVALVEDGQVDACLSDAPDSAAIVIMTHDHALDYRLTLAALRRSRTAYCGLIGSATKRARFLSKLEKDGIGAEGVARLTCPIGLPGIAGKEPDVIATALLAQLLTLGAGA